jgi:hypothetical protein
MCQKCLKSDVPNCFFLKMSFYFVSQNFKYIYGEPELIYKKNFKPIGLSSGNNYLSGVKKKSSIISLTLKAY